MTTKELFDSQFKFQVNQSVKHRGDTKEKHVSDLGLLILNRVIIEELDDDGESRFNRMYQCRVLRFSGSGDVISFKESELMSEEEYVRMGVELDIQRQGIREEMNATRDRVFKHFGVARKSVVKLKGDDNTWQVCGFHAEGGKYSLSLRLEEGNSAEDSKSITSPDEIEKVL